jgi:hypothetical protein
MNLNIPTENELNNFLNRKDFKALFIVANNQYNIIYTTEIKSIEGYVDIDEDFCKIHKNHPFFMYTDKEFEINENQFEFREDSNEFALIDQSKVIFWCNPNKLEYLKLNMEKIKLY